MDIWDWYREENLAAREESSWTDLFSNIFELNRDLYSMWLDQYPHHPMAKWWEQMRD